MPLLTLARYTSASFKSLDPDCKGLEIMKYTRDLATLQMKDVGLVGGKNASLGQIIGNLSTKGIRVPGGFALTAEAYRLHITENKLKKPLQDTLKLLPKGYSLKALQKVGKQARLLIEQAPLPDVIEREIISAYEQLCLTAKQKNCSVAVRSSATAEDLPDASFAGQQETFLNVTGAKNVVAACKKSMASLFTDRAIVYRIEKKFDHFAVALSVGVQLMVRSDKASAGVMFTIDTEGGFKDALVIASAYGLGESVVQGDVVPDEFHVFKPMLAQGKRPLIKKELGAKERERVFARGKSSVSVKKVSPARAQKFSLTDDEIFELAQYGMIIEDYYSKLRGSWCPMDIEWAKDGINKKLYIVQARPETVHAQKFTDEQVLEMYSVQGSKNAPIISRGQSIGGMAATGIARIINTPKEADTVKKGDIIVTTMTDPDWVPVMKRVAGIITQSGGRTCHAAIVSRELGIPAIVGAHDALKSIKDGQEITMDCSAGAEGVVYGKKLAVSVKKISLKTLKKSPVPIQVNMAAPDRAYQTAKLPVVGVGLARLEFIISNQVRIHPMGCVRPQAIKDAKTRTLLKQLTASYKNPQDFFIKKVAEGVGMIAAAFYPRPVLVRLSDFKSNEYRNLVGGSWFEPIEENPMMGLRGAARYTHELYAPAFELECKAIKYAREQMGLTNINIMIPFVRTLTEAQKTRELLKKHGLSSGDQGLQVYMMCEIPSNVILLEQFAKYFDGFSIGSNDLTQTTLSVDRDSGLLASIFDERDPAVMFMLQAAIEAAKRAKKPIGICGQAPSDHPDIAAFLIKHGISSLSLNPDSVLPFMMAYSEKK